MQAGENGFADACFSDGEVRSTEFSNLDLFAAPIQKKPASTKRPAQANSKKLATWKKPATACCKKPAAQQASEKCEEEVEEEDLESDECAEESEECAQETEPVKLLDRRYTMPNLARIDLGNFTEKSYIRFQQPGMKAKWPYLVGCTAQKASKHGKHHHEIMNQMFQFVTTFPSVPSKAVCKNKLRDLLVASA